MAAGKYMPGAGSNHNNINPLKQANAPMFGLRDVFEHVTKFRDDVALTGEQALRLARVLADATADFITTEQVTAKLNNTKGPLDLQADYWKQRMHEQQIAQLQNYKPYFSEVEALRDEIDKSTISKLAGLIGGGSSPKKKP